MTCTYLLSLVDTVQIFYQFLFLIPTHWYSVQSVWPTNGNRTFFSIPLTSLSSIRKNRTVAKIIFIRVKREKKKKNGTIISHALRFKIQNDRLLQRFCKLMDFYDRHAIKWPTQMYAQFTSKQRLGRFQLMNVCFNITIYHTCTIRSAGTWRTSRKLLKTVLIQTWLGRRICYPNHLGEKN